MKFIVLIGLLLSSIILHAEDVVVLTKNAKDLEVLKKWVKVRKFEWKAEGSNFALIGAGKQKETWAEGLKAIRALPQVKEVRKDEKWSPKNCIPGFLGDCQKDPSVDENLVQQIESIKAKLDVRNDCRLSPSCGGKNPSWGPMSIGADLADEKVSEILQEKKGEFPPLAQPEAKVAVVDSGFDQAGQTSALAASSINVFKGYDQAGKESEDQDGHGTAVASMVAGKYTGITHHAQLSVYRITQATSYSSEDDGGSVSTAILAQAVEKACRDGNDVVNLSWGSAEEEKKVLKVVNELWYSVAKSYGCLVVSSAGNGGVRQKGDGKEKPFQVEIDDPLLTVAATNPYEDLANFSTIGMVQAPGEGVFVLHSDQATYSEEDGKKQCMIEDEILGQINGTSFSSPAVAGVAAQVITVLKARKLWPVDPSQKLKLVKQILMTSQNFPERRNSINALAAVEMAYLLTKENIDQGPENWTSILAEKNRNYCQVKSKKCYNMVGCSDTVECTNDLRKRYFLCPFDSDDKHALVDSLLVLNEDALAKGFARELDKKSMTSEEASNLVKIFWNNGLNRDKEVMSFSQALKTMELSLQWGVSDFLSSDKWKQLLKSKDRNKLMTIQDTVAHQSGWDGFTDRAVDLFVKMDEKEQIKLIRSFQNNYDHDHLEQIGLLYQLLLRKEKLSENVKRIVLEKAKSILQDWRDDESISTNDRSDSLNFIPMALFLSETTSPKDLPSWVNQLPTRENYPKYLWAISSPSVLGEKARAELALKLFKLEIEAKIDDYDFEMNILKTIENQLSSLLLDEKQAVWLKEMLLKSNVDFELKDDFLSNPNNQSWWNDPTFVKSLAQKNMALLERDLKSSNESEVKKIDGHFNNIAICLQSSVNSTLASESKEQLGQVLDLYGPKFMELAQNWTGPKRNQFFHVLGSIEAMTVHKDLLKELGLYSQFTDSLAPVKRWLSEHPELSIDDDTRQTIINF